MRKAVTIGVVILGLVAVAVAVNRKRSPPPQGKETAPSARESGLRSAPDFSFKDYDGNTVTLAQFRGTPLVVNSWAAWCPFCREELKDFAVVQKEFGDRLVIIAIDRAEPLATAKKYSDELGVTSDLIFLLDPSDSFYQSIGGFSMPETIFVDREGRIVFHKRGPMDASEIRERVTRLLGGVDSPLPSVQ